MAARSRVERSRKRPAERTFARRAHDRAQDEVEQRKKGEAKVNASSGIVEAALAAFAHEVRTPLTGILAISDLLATSDLGERERRWVETIKGGAEHLSALATLFVDAAKSAKAEATLREDLFNLRALSRSVGDSLAGRAAAKGLRSQVEIADDLPSLVIGDPIRLRAALENLIDNAVKFTEKGGVALKVKPTRRAKGKTGAVFAVSDSGIGLSLREIKRLFRPFSQANVTIAARFGGAGLGLYSVKQLARAMGGDIVASERAGGGTTFTLTVILAAAQPAKGGGSGLADAVASRTLRVLSVEDNPFARVVLNTVLSELGHQAEFVGRGEDAIARIEQAAFDCVLVDMVLPDIEGLEAIRRIRRLSPPLMRIPVIGVSHRDEDEAASRAAGADAFLLKPVSSRALATALLEATRRSAAATS